jgi:hypothetical protein
MHMDGETGPFQVFPGSPNQQFEAAERFRRSRGFATAQTERCFVMHVSDFLKIPHFRATHRHAPETGVHAAYDAVQQMDLRGNGKLLSSYLARLALRKLCSYKSGAPPYKAPEKRSPDALPELLPELLNDSWVQKISSEG